MKHKILFTLIALAAIVFYGCDKEFATVNDDGTVIKKQQKEGEVVCPTNDPEITYILIDTNMLYYDGIVRHVTGFYVLENDVVVNGVIYVDGNLVWEFALPPNDPKDTKKMYFAYDFDILIHSQEYPIEFCHEILNNILMSYN